jgi:hypothetical protein
MGAFLPLLSSDFTTNHESPPDIDSIAAYLGILSFSYESVAGELWYRTVMPDPDWSEDCIYCIEQGMAAQDPEITTSALEEPVVIDAGFELRVIPSATPEQPPAAYQHAASLFDPGDGDDTTEAGVTTSNLSIGPYPGLRHEQDATHTGDNTSFLFYAQTLPWGTIHWDIVFDPALEISLSTADHQAWLQQRRHRDQNYPAMAPKSHWRSTHDGGRSGKGRFRGDIQPILSETDDSDVDQTNLHRAEGSMAGTSAVSQETALSFGDGSTHTNP